MAHINEGDEAAFVECAEANIMNLVKLARPKVQLLYVPVIEACMKVEDMTYMEALKDAGLPSTAVVFKHRRAIDAYQDISETVARNLETLVRKDWQSKFAETPPLALFRILSGRASISIGHVDTNIPEGFRKRRSSGGGGSSGASGHSRHKALKRGKPGGLSDSRGAGSGAGGGAGAGGGGAVSAKPAGNFNIRPFDSSYAPAPGPGLGPGPGPGPGLGM
jgi:hypothetical protein